MPILSWVFFALMVVVIILLYVRDSWQRRQLTEKDKQIKTLAGLALVTLPADYADFLEGEMKRAKGEVEAALKKKDLARQAYYEGYRSALRNVRITVGRYIEKE